MIVPQYMYEAYLKALDDDIEFKTELAPFPVYQANYDQKSMEKVVAFTLVLGIALAIIPT